MKLKQLGDSNFSQSALFQDKQLCIAIQVLYYQITRKNDFVLI